MIINNSKKALAAKIRNSGFVWPDSGKWAIQDKDGEVFVCSGTSVPVRRMGEANWEFGEPYRSVGILSLGSNWFQCILSRDEYFFLYQDQGLEDDLNEDWPDADGWIEWGGGERPVAAGAHVDLKWSDGFEPKAVKPESFRWQHLDSQANIIAYRLHKPEQSNHEYCESVMHSIPEPSDKPTIEQLAADYRNAKDYADRKQQEADAAKADAEVKLKALELAGDALGLLVSPITAKQELVITDWRDLRVGDRIWVGDSGYDNNCPAGEYDIIDRDHGDDGQPVGVMWSGGAHWPQIHERGWRFIRRP